MLSADRERFHTRLNLICEDRDGLVEELRTAGVSSAHASRAGASWRTFLLILHRTGSNNRTKSSEHTAPLLLL